jgi:uncharacterized protein YndB with AHSA1/START domain
VGSTTERVAVERKVDIAASPETVWSFLVDPDKITRWWGTRAEFHPTSGEGWRVEIAGRNVARGEILEADPPRRLVYTFGWEAGGNGLPELLPSGSSVVEFDLIPTATGTTVRLVHREIPGGELASSHAAGWQHYLGRLAIAAVDGDPGPDPWATGEM